MTKKFYTRAFIVALLCIFLGGGNASAEQGKAGALKSFAQLKNYSPAGEVWKSNFSIDWDTQYLEVVIDGSGCAGTAENLFSIAGATVAEDERLDWWGVYDKDARDPKSAPARCHVYSFWNSNILQCYVFKKSASSKTDHHKDGFVESVRSHLVFKMSKANGLQVTLGENGSTITVFSPSDIGDDFFQQNMTIGSEEGTGRMHGTYKSVRLMNNDDTPVPVESDAVITSTRPNPDAGKVIKELVPEGKTFPFKASAQFEVVSDIDWNTQKIVAQVDLSTCTGENDFFAMTTGDGNFKNFDASSANDPNIHCYWTKGNSTFSTFLVINGADNGNSGGITVPADKIMNLDLSKDNGTMINGSKIYNHEATNHKWQKITAKNRVKVGTGENNKSYNATYNYIRIVGVDNLGTTTGNTLDEAAVNTFEGQNNVTVALKRSFVPGQWNTICLPFNVNATKMAELFGTYELCTLDNVQNNVMNFSAVAGGAITAGQPYLLKPSTDVANPTFKGVDIVAGEPTQVDVATGWGMKGTYGVTTLATDGSNLFIVTGGKFMKPETAEKAVMKGMRAYFIVPSGTNAKLLRANLDGVETSIDAIGTDDAVIVDTTVYTIQGQRVGNTLEGLPRGLYIQNGKKVLVK